MNASMQGYHHYHQQQQHQQHQHQHQQHQQQQHQQHGLNGPVYQPQHQQSLYNHYQPPPQNDYQAHAYSSTPHLHPQQHISPHQHQHGYPHPHPHSRPHPHPHPHQHLQQYQSCISEDENVSPYPHLQPPALSQSSPAAVGSPPQPTAVPSNFATASAINIKAKAPRNPTPSACANCKRTHLACDSSRPCKRCVARNETSTCIDLPPKKRGRPTAAQKNARAILPEQAATTLVTASAAASARTPDAAAMSTQTKADMDIDETVTSAASALMVIKKRPNEMTSPQLAPNQANESTSKDIKRPRYDVPITPRPDSAMQISSPLLSSPPPPQPASSLPPLPQQVAVVESSSTSVPATQAFLDDGSNFEPVRIIADLNGVCVVVPDSTAHFLGIRPADLLFTKFSTSVTPNDQGSVDNLLFFVGANNTRVRLMERGLLPRNAPPQMTAVTNRPAMTSRLNLSSLMPSLPKRIGGPSIGGSGGSGGIPPPKLAKPQDRDSVPARDPREVSNLLHTLPNETLFKTPNLMSGETVVDIRRHGSFSKAKASFGHVAYSTKSSSTKGEDILDCIVIMISPVSSTSSPPIAGVPAQQIVAL
ncbi:hypothetical protein GQ42DRAFT_162108 [Ramicandelaber brevisporus]|nr:hypothetical protein GQ42DRAFT_162108 [Ramicandelaber brevisporus]